MHLNIKQKLIIIVALVLFGYLSLFINNTLNQNKLSELVSINSDLKNIEVLMLQLRRAEKDFVLRQDIKYLTSFDATVNKISLLISSLKNGLINTDIPMGKTSSIGPDINTYQNTFKQLVDESLVKGLDKNSGSYGKLRNATHELETFLASVNNLQAQVYLLTLRRYEKDFMLRNDEKYVAELIAVAQQLDGLLTDTRSKVFI